jgi:hypothetical protein
MQFYSSSIAKCLLHKAFLDWAKTQFDPIRTQFQPNSAAKRLSDMAFRGLGLGADMRGTALCSTAKSSSKSLYRWRRLTGPAHGRSFLRKGIDQQLQSHNSVAPRYAHDDC